jgi:uncharacterized protein (DUF1330 family)
MAAYCLFDIPEETDSAKMQEYRKRVFLVVAQYGGKYLVIGGPLDAVEGNWRPVFPVLIEFPSLEQAHRWYNSEEYRDLKELRLAATKGHAVFMAGAAI